METPLITYMREVLNEHTLPLAGKNAGGLIEAVWLVDMIHKVEEHYKINDPK